MISTPVRAIAVFFCVAMHLGSPTASAGELRAGVAKVDITDDTKGAANDRLFARVLVLRDASKTLAFVTVDAVAIGEIGPIGNDYLPTVRSQLEKTLEIRPEHVIVNASHCHGSVVRDGAARTVLAVRDAVKKLEPVRVGAGTGHEDRVQENRRLVLKSGRIVDVRHAYSLPPNDEVTKSGPVDPEIGVLRIDRLDGRPLGVLYNFAVHPIQGAAGGGNTADLSGHASRVIEENLGEGSVALFVQGAGGDINPVGYKDVHQVRDAEPLGMRLGLSTLRAAREIESRRVDEFAIIREVIQLPRANLAKRIAEMKKERDDLVASLRGTFLNLDTFLPLAAKYGVSPEFPSGSSYRYLRERQRGTKHLERLDEQNRAHLAAYVRNIRTMEKITRLQTNLRLLEKHQSRGHDAGRKTIDIELSGLRVGDFVLTTFPGELCVEIGLNIKKASPHELTFVAGCTNGYVYYAPTAEQLRNRGGAQEDSDCLLAPEWQKIYEAKALEIIRGLLDESAKR